MNSLSMGQYCKLGLLMPRYFFHCRGDEERILDEGGAELQDLEAARISANNIVARMLKRGLSDWTGWVLEIADAHGRVVAEVSFAEFTQH